MILSSNSIENAQKTDMDLIFRTKQSDSYEHEEKQNGIAQTFLKGQPLIVLLFFMSITTNPGN